MLGMATTTRGRPRSFDRDAALDKAIRLFWESGYEATTVRDLGAALGIGAPSLYHAFGDKQSLFTEAVQVYDRTYGGFIEAALTEEPTAAGAVRRILAEAPDRYTRRGLPRGCLVVHGDAGTDDDAVHRSLTRLRSLKARMLEEKIAADVVADRLPEDTDAVALAGYVMAVLGGLALRARDGATRRDLIRIADVAAAACP